MEVFLGVDGGGSKTHAVLCDTQGNILARAQAGGLNYRADGIDYARQSLQEIVTRLAGFGPPRAAFIGSAALAGPAPSAELEALCGGILDLEHVAMDSDLFIALEAMRTPEEVQNQAFRCGENERKPSAHAPLRARGAPCRLTPAASCAVAVAGMGSMAAGRAGEGRPVLHAGGWGWLLGDEGSGYDLAVRAMRAGVRGYEGSGPPTALTGAMCAFFGARPECPEELLELLYDPPRERRKIAAFARAVLESGDPVARELVTACAADFARTAGALLARLPGQTQLALWGGLFQHSAAYRAAFCKALGREASLLPRPPEWGAAMAAFLFSEEKRKRKKTL